MAKFQKEYCREKGTDEKESCIAELQFGHEECSMILVGITRIQLGDIPEGILCLGELLEILWSLGMASEFFVIFYLLFW